MNVLSLFDGMACGLVALKRAGIAVNNYYASEIDKYAIKVAKKNHPEIKHVGDVRNITNIKLPKIDLILAGSPCQGFSFAGRQLAFEDPRSSLFFEFVAAYRWFRPKYFFLENVRMKKQFLEIITQHLGCEPVLINSGLVSAQNRNRYYWFNWECEKPNDKGVLLKDVVDGYATRDKSQCLLATMYKENAKSMLKMKKQGLLVYDRPIRVADINGGGQGNRVYSIDGKSISLTAQSGGMAGPGNMLIDQCGVRKLSVTECERLQTLPDGYTEGVSNTQRYKMLGNGWTVDVVSHILKSMPKI